MPPLGSQAHATRLGDSSHMDTSSLRLQIALSFEWICVYMAGYIQILFKFTPRPSERDQRSITLMPPLGSQAHATRLGDFSRLVCPLYRCRKNQMITFSDSHLGELYKKSVPCKDLVPLVVDILVKQFGAVPREREDVED
ncbi:hypothetical protein NC653_023338 [Populus alba x Populus x berolinensis]|uniref:Uncharacterized protein n=1 Tax=Populus alba x Populus x berolinensis TaxID=444605 RepID=A0AAD6QC16_9ROSI|nr:hypothetical protein NC653_023338 [Populus alba x Populus x berolinensis]